MEESPKEEKQRSMMRNYFILFLLFLVCILFVLYICKVYQVNQEEKLKIPVIRDSILEIYPEDLEHYVLDNSVSVIYVCTANDPTCRSFEKSFKKLLKKNNYNEEVIYLNVTDIDQEEFIKEFNEKYTSKAKLTTNYPAFILFEDGKASSILQGREDKPLTIAKVKNYLELHEIGE